MANITFRYGTMGSGKTASVLMTKYNYEEHKKRVLLLKPKTDIRDGENSIKSRVGLTSPCELVENMIDQWKQAESMQDRKPWEDVDIIMIDEAQFMSNADVCYLVHVADDYNIPVVCYGLRTDFLGVLFEGSQALIENADVLEELPAICWCGEKACMNARIQNGKVVRYGNQIDLGGNDKYVALCRKHYNNGVFQPRIIPKRQEKEWG